jgi:hypothetical protein
VHDRGLPAGRSAQSKFKLLPHPNKAWSQCSGDSYVLYRRKIGERRLEIDF